MSSDFENSMLFATQSVVPIVPRNTREVHEDVVHEDFSREKCSEPRDECVVIFRTVPSEYFPQYVSQSGEVPNVLKQFLVEMNINIAAAEATELEHKKTFDELSGTKIEEIAASNQQHKEKRLKEQETKLSNDRNTTELKRTQESVGDQEAFLANLGQLDICEMQKIAETIETLHEYEDHARDHFSKTKQTGIVPSTDMQGVPTSWKR